MAENSSIEWCHHTFNPWIGCQHVSPGCDLCYAETQNNFYKWNPFGWGPHAPRKRTAPANWKKPLAWAKAARSLPYRPRVFSASLADWLDNRAPQEWRDDLADLIRATPELDWLLLTKRIENFEKLNPFGATLPDNVWLGSTIENRAVGLRRGWMLAQIPAKVRFWSCEPLLEDLGDLTGLCLQAAGWVIVGGESGKGARVMEEAWAANIMRQCEAAGVAFFMKQMTGKQPIPPHLMVRRFPTYR